MLEYLIVNGQKVSKSQFYKALVMHELEKFAYDKQLQLFPDPQVEEVRTQLRKQFDVSKTIDVEVI